MRADSIHYHFEGFDPDYDLKSIVSAIAQELHMSAPSDASLKLTFKKEKNFIKGHCRIASSSRSFVAEAIGFDLIDTAMEIENPKDIED